MPERRGGGDDGQADRLATAPQARAAGHRNLLIAGALIASGAVLRFLTLYSLDALLATFGVGPHPPFPSIALAVRELAHALANGTAYGFLFCGIVLAVWRLRLVRKRIPA